MQKGIETERYSVMAARGEMRQVDGRKRGGERGKEGGEREGGRGKGEQ